MRQTNNKQAADPMARSHKSIINEEQSVAEFHPQLFLTWQLPVGMRLGDLSINIIFITP